jgi:amidase
MTTDLPYAGVAGQAAAVAAGEITALDLTRQALDRIERLEPRLNAFSEVLRESALAEAVARDESPTLGPLHGVPIAIKQEYDVAGSVTTYGGHGNSTPARDDSEVVRRLRSAGAVVVGKTCMPEFGQWPFGESKATGITRNPWDGSRSTGGSSAGTGAAVAAGMVAAGMGGDGGGSIRIPASCCGLFGLKPSRGRVSTAPNEHLWLSLGTLGPLTRSVLDSAIIYDVISGSQPSDLFQAPPPDSLVDAAHRPPGRLRIGWCTRPATKGIRPYQEVVACVESLARTLADLGHAVRPVDPAYPDATAAFLPLFFAGVRAEAEAVEHYERLELRTRQTVRLGAWAGPGAVRRAMVAGEKVAAKANRVFADVDVLLTPTIPSLPPRAPRLKHGGAPEALLRSLPMVSYTALWNVTGNPAANVPAGVSRAGLPIGAQLVGRMYDEATLVSLSAQLEEAIRWTDRRPLL